MHIPTTRFESPSCKLPAYQRTVSTKEGPLSYMETTSKIHTTKRLSTNHSFLQPYEMATPGVFRDYSNWCRFLLHHLPEAETHRTQPIIWSKIPNFYRFETNTNKININLTKNNNINLSTTKNNNIQHINLNNFNNKLNNKPTSQTTLQNCQLKQSTQRHIINQSLNTGQLKILATNNPTNTLSTHKKNNNLKINAHEALTFHPTIEINAHEALTSYLTCKISFDTFKIKLNPQVLVILSHGYDAVQDSLASQLNYSEEHGLLNFGQVISHYKAGKELPVSGFVGIWHLISMNGNMCSLNVWAESTTQLDLTNFELLVPMGMWNMSGWAAKKIIWTMIIDEPQKVMTGSKNISYEDDFFNFYLQFNVFVRDRVEKRPLLLPSWIVKHLDPDGYPPLFHTFRIHCLLPSPGITLLIGSHNTTISLFVMISRIEILVY